jgi:hypothetical protein
MFGYMGGKRQLDEYAVNRRVVVQLGNILEELKFTKILVVVLV